MLRMKSAEIWNYLVLCTHVYTSRALEGPGLRESIEFSNKSAELLRLSFRIIFAWWPLFTATARVTRAQFARNFARHLRETPRAAFHYHCGSRWGGGGGGGGGERRAESP